jgi:uncharacterized phage protein (TIGR01671 family)
MRPIKFRAWHKYDRKMRMVKSIEFNDESGLPECVYLAGLSTLPDKIGSVELMQHTGINDRRGAEIYEGDIVKSEFGLIYEVRIGGYFNGKRLAFGVFACNSRDDVTSNIYEPEDFKEVIGNIYENPELLEKREL